MSSSSCISTPGTNQLPSLRLWWHPYVQAFFRSSVCGFLSCRRPPNSGRIRPRGHQPFLSKGTPTPPTMHGEGIFGSRCPEAILSSTQHPAAARHATVPPPRAPPRNSAARWRSFPREGLAYSSVAVMLVKDDRTAATLWRLKRMSPACGCER